MSPFNMDNSRVLLVFQSYFGLYDGGRQFSEELPPEYICIKRTSMVAHRSHVFYYHYRNE